MFCSVGLLQFSSLHFVFFPPLNSVIDGCFQEGQEVQAPLVVLFLGFQAVISSFWWSQPYGWLKRNFLMVEQETTHPPPPPSKRQTSMSWKKNKVKESHAQLLFVEVCSTSPAPLSAFKGRRYMLHREKKDQGRSKKDGHTGCDCRGRGGELIRQSRRQQNKHGPLPIILSRRCVPLCPPRYGGGCQDDHLIGNTTVK